MTDADVLLRRAHRAGYRLPHDFPGFSATVHTGSGDAGRLVVRGRTDLALTFDGTTTADAHWARQELASMVSHRWASRYDDSDGRWAKRADRDAGVDTVKVLDDPFDSAYRLRDEMISEVHRTAGDIRFVIAVSERTTVPDGRYLPTHFTVFHWATATGQLIRAEHFVDLYVPVGDVHLPARRQVVAATADGLTTRTLTLSDHKVGTDV
jgi:hypothetical protein